MYPVVWKVYESQIYQVLDQHKVSRDHFVSSQVQGIKVSTWSQEFKYLLYIEIFERQNCYFRENWLLANLLNKWVELILSIALIKKAIPDFF